MNKNFKPIWVLNILLVLFFSSCTSLLEKEKARDVATEKIDIQDFHEFYQSELFQAVQLAGIFEDSKTFVDCKPQMGLKKIQISYLAEKDNRDFDLKDFVLAHFNLPEKLNSEFKTDQNNDMFAHIESLWPVLTREKDDDLNSSLIPLPNAYVVPGGRFREIYYWDSYFTMLGLKAAGKEDLAISMLDNFAHLIATIGFIPNGNRAYYTGRSQPPFFALMVDELVGNDRSKFISYHKSMTTEYEFWMRGHNKLSQTESAIDRVVLLDGDIVLNRYYDEFPEARPESFKEDYELVKENKLPEERTYRHLRAGAESGWDYSSRWFADPKKMATIQTTNIIPIDLNVLLYLLEVKIAQSFNWQEKLDSADFYLAKANDRKNAINSLLWDESKKRYADYHFRNKAHTNVLSMATAYPLFAKIAPKDKARSVIKQMKDKLLLEGGLVSTTINSGQQWDYPNAWAPLQWVGMQAFFNYGDYDAGLDLISRWLSLNEKVYLQTGKMMEKYNVADTSLQAGGGEYPLQDGFGWTNGVAVAMKKILNEKRELSDL